MGLTFAKLFAGLLGKKDMVIGKNKKTKQPQKEAKNELCLMKRITKAFFFCFDNVKNSVF